MCAKGRIAVVLYGLFGVIKIRKIRVFRYRLSKNNTSNCNFMMAMKTTMTAEGRVEEKMDNARKMKADNMPTDLIAKYTGLTIEEIEAL